MDDSSSRVLCALLLEDSDIDAELVVGHLAKAGLVCTIKRAIDRKTFLDAVESGECEIILADYALPDFDGLSALTIAKALAPDIPFVFVSGVVGEEFATAAIKRGATDYVLKRNLTRLGTAVERALTEARQRGERRWAEEALARSELNHRLAIEGAGLGVWSFDRRTGALAIDARCKTLCGLAEDAEVSLGRLMRLCWPNDRLRLRAVARRAARPDAGDDGVFTLEIVVDGLDGRERTLAVHGQAIFEAGICLRFAGVASDVTDQRRAHDALERLNERLEAEVEARTAERDRIWRLSRDLFAVLDLKGRFKQVNPAWTAHLGHAAGAMLTVGLSDLLHVDDFEVARGIFQGLNSDGPDRFDARVRHADGNWRWIAWTATPERDAFYVVGRDITEEKLAADALAMTNNQLRSQIDERQQIEQTLQQMQRLEAVGQLTSGVAHDFNNLLTVILGNITFVERALPELRADPAIAKRVGHMRTAAERGASLTAQLLAFSRKQKLAPKALDLNEAVGGMRELLQSTMGGSIRIEAVLKPGLWPALVDPTQIEMIILNLAINSRDAMEVGGGLTIETNNVTVTQAPVRPEEPAPGEYVELSVSDTGHGMPEEVLAKAFEPFFTTKAVGKGSGLGLAQVFGFAKQSGGGVRIDTRMGEGTSVRVYLPRAALEEARAVAAGLAPLSAVAANTTILVVDDDSAVREITISLLTEMGYQIVEAGSGTAALTLLSERPDIDLLLVDYAMPGMSGVETATRARAMRPNLPCMYVTGYADLAALREVGGQSVVQKPFAGDELARKVQAVLGGPSDAENVVSLTSGRRRDPRG
ncbi:response regulator [Caulobacter hibisci]|uniref:histidine kinase n=2 Tax=Caulobacter hibisci TaxID=2035993 RepID=A0ABS0SZ71_9CAUL|nr:response regulator [Caulobacter hibisci]